MTFRVPLCRVGVWHESKPKGGGDGKTRAPGRSMDAHQGVVAWDSERSRADGNGYPNMCGCGALDRPGPGRTGASSRTASAQGTVYSSARTGGRRPVSGNGYSSPFPMIQTVKMS